jgi:hypothetical protein
LGETKQSLTLPAFREDEIPFLQNVTLRFCLMEKAHTKIDHWSRNAPELHKS